MWNLLLSVCVVRTIRHVSGPSIRVAVVEWLVGELVVSLRRRDSWSLVRHHLLGGPRRVSKSRCALTRFFVAAEPADLVCMRRALLLLLIAHRSISLSGNKLTGSIPGLLNLGDLSYLTCVRNAAQCRVCCWVRLSSCNAFLCGCLQLPGLQHQQHPVCAREPRSRDDAQVRAQCAVVVGVARVCVMPAGVVTAAGTSTSARTSCRPCHTSPG
jgi:hypothetical protein